jgi:hypothetical protein
MKFRTLSATARSFSAAQPPSSSEFTAEKKLGGKEAAEGEKQRGNFGSEIFQGKGAQAAPQTHHVIVDWINATPCNDEG